MSTTDRTGAKLVDSMRKSKAAASDRAGASQNAAPGWKGEPQPSNSGEGGASRRPSGVPGVRHDDPYQSGRRIWPD